jgi:integrase
MANLKVTIVVRTTSSDGKRGWVPATGKNDPSGPLYLRWYEGSSAKHQFAGKFYDEAEAAQLKQERKLKASSQGFILPEEKDTKKFHRGHDVLDSYLKYLLSTTKRNGRKFADIGPLKRRTKPQPFRKEEVDAMMENAGEHRLLLRLARGTGMRKGELMHAEHSDLDKFKKCIRIQDKPKYGWETKTLASVREIPLGDDLPRDLLSLSDGLLFPNTEHSPDEHIDRRFQAVGEAAGVKPPADDKASWCHRWRDTYATDLVRSRKLQLRDIAVLMGHEDLKTMDLYAEHVRMDSQEARDAANVVDSHGDKPGPRIVRRTA